MLSNHASAHRLSEMVSKMTSSTSGDAVSAKEIQGSPSGSRSPATPMAPLSQNNAGKHSVTDPAATNATSSMSNPTKTLGLTQSPERANLDEYAEEERNSNKPKAPTASTDVSTKVPTTPKSPKRALSHEPDEQSCDPKRAKLSASPADPLNDDIEPSSFPSPPECAATEHDQQSWQGFCEIESDPAYFSVILREMGVKDITVREAFGLSPDLLDMLPQPIHGLILLFRYREFGHSPKDSDPPKNVWFSNQLPAQNSCGTLAMINILMNSNGVEIGEHLRQFKDFTSDFMPFQRGEAFANFDFVKKIHNSFAKKMDILENDVQLAAKVRRSRDHKARTGKSLFKKTARRQSDDSVVTNTSVESFEENGHHFVAFVPVDNKVWKLDGLDKQPACMGTFDVAKDDWLTIASDSIAALMAAGDDDYSIIALTDSPLKSLRQKACLSINTLSQVETRLDALGEEWKAFLTDEDISPSPQMLGIEGQLDLISVPESVQAKINQEALLDLLDRRGRLAQELNKLATQVLEEMGAEAEEDSRAAARRFDSGPLIKKWLEMLAENGYLEANLDRFREG